MIAAKYVGAALIGALAAALAFLIVLSLFELEVTDKESPAETAGHASEPDNLIKNSSAEDGVKPWDKNKTATLTAAPSNGVGVVGSNVFRVKRTAAGGGTVSAFSPDIRVTTGDVLTVSANFVSMPNGETANVGIDWSTVDGTYISHAISSADILSSSGRAATSATAPLRAAIATVVISLYDTSQNDVFEFDDVRAEITSGR